MCWHPCPGHVFLYDSFPVGTDRRCSRWAVVMQSWHCWGTSMSSDTRLTRSVRPRIEGFGTQLGSTICLGTVASTCIHYPTLQWDHGVSFSHRCTGSACAASSIPTLLPFEVVHYTPLVHCLSHWLLLLKHRTLRIVFPSWRSPPTTHAPVQISVGK